MSCARNLPVFLAALLLAAASAAQTPRIAFQQNTNQSSPANNQKEAQPGKKAAEQNNKSASQNQGAKHASKQEDKRNAPATSEAGQPTRTSQGSATTSAMQAARRASDAANTLVWVNTQSKVYHLPGSRWYGKTKHGKYMTESDARRAGYHPEKKE